MDENTSPPIPGDVLRAILADLPLGIRILDADSLVVLESNRADAELTGLPPEEIVGRPSPEVWPADPEMQEARAGMTEEARRHGSARRFGLPYRSRSGATLLVDVIRRAVEVGGRHYHVVIFEDARHRLATEQATREAAELRAAAMVANTAAHEINNPLAVVTGRLDLLRAALPPDHAALPLVDKAMEAAWRIGDIVARMHALTRLERRPAGHLPPTLDLRASSEPSGEPPAR